MGRRDAFADDPVFRSYLSRALDRRDLARAEPHLSGVGRDAGGILDEKAREANAKPPTLSSDGDVVLGEAYLELARRGYESGLVRLAYRGPGGPLPRVATFGMGYLFSQAEQGFFCPVCLTDGTARLVSRFAPEDLRGELLDGLLAERFEDQREGAMWMTERSGGSDVSGITSYAVAKGDGMGVYGEKFFASNANAHLAAVLARAPDAAPGSEGLGLYLLDARDGAGPGAPRSDGVRVARLKDKLGTRSMATGEVLLDGARGLELGGAPQ
ncbi:MAG: acyl-CoA dehydrogenase family protein, partial [Methanobacteriota archaeon]